MIWHLLKRRNQAGRSRALGQLGEAWAQEEYKKRGYKIVAANEYNKKGKRLGEIDIIAQNKHTLKFVEVKTRTAGVNKFGRGVESVNWSKQIKILKAVKVYLLKHPELAGLRPQIDVCAIEVRDVDKKDYSVIITENSVEDWN